MKDELRKEIPNRLKISGKLWGSQDSSECVYSPLAVHSTQKGQLQVQTEGDGGL